MATGRGLKIFALARVKINYDRRTASFYYAGDTDAFVRVALGSCDAGVRGIENSGRSATRARMTFGRAGFSRGPFLFSSPRVTCSGRTVTNIFRGEII